MSKLRWVILSALLIAALFVSSIVGTAFYYNGLLNGKNSEITSLKGQVADENNQIANLTNQIENFNAQSAYLNTQLGIIDYVTNSTPYDGPSLAAEGIDGLYIKGSVANVGNMTAYNAGLHVVGYDANNTLWINMTVPLAYAAGGSFNNALFFGTDNKTQSYADNQNSINGVVASLKLESLDSGKGTMVNVNIIHEGIVSNWTVTPVWTNIP